MHADLPGPLPMRTHARRWFYSMTSRAIQILVLKKSVTETRNEKDD